MPCEANQNTMNGTGTLQTDKTGGTAGEAAAPPATFEPSRASILMVDDQPARLLTYEALLAGLPVTCVRALSGKEALEKLLTQSFALILLDVQMPEMDGFEVARLIRQHPRHELTPIIFVTGVSFNEFDQLKGYQVGAVDYLSVPVVPEIFRSKIAVLTELHRRQDEFSQLAHGQDAADIAKREVRASADAVETARRTRAIFEHPSDMTLVLEAERDASGAIQDWVYCDANRMALSILNHTRESLLGRRVSEIVPARAKTAIANCTRVLETGETVRYELHFGGRDHLVTIFRIGVDCVASTALDITDRKHLERELRASEARYQTLIEHAPVAVAHTAIDGKFQYINSAFCKLVGYSAEELKGKTWQDITHPDDQAEEWTLGARAIMGEIGHYTTERRVVCKDGSDVWVTLFGNFVFDSNQQAIQRVNVAIDITTRKQALEQLKESDRRKDEFLALLAHELRNPIAPILNVAHVMSRSLTKNDPHHPLVGIVQRQTVHLSRLLDDLLDVARITQGRLELRREWVLLSHCVETAIETVNPAIRERGHRLVVAPIDESPQIHVDPVRIAQAIANLLSNATKFSPPGETILLKQLLEGETAVIQVCDNGIGIAPEYLARIFELFTQSERITDRSRGGLGLGLALAKNLIEMHGGTVTASSEGLGKGSLFEIRLPLTFDTKSRSVSNPIDEPQPLRVLIVDDNQDAANSLALLLQQDGHDVRATYTGEQALRLVPEFLPEMVLLDLGLPGIDGYETAQRLQLIAPEARIVALSGYGQPEDRKRTAAAGFDGHLTKPVDPDVLAKEMRAVVKARPG
jgi:PAS domain S-box-containing protein